MKNSYILLLALTLFFVSCDKDTEEGNETSTFTINGQSYSPVKTFYRFTDEALIGINNEDINKATTGIYLGFEEKPTTSGSFEVAPWQKDGPFTGEIYLEITIDGNKFYESSGQSGDYASVSILSGGRLKVTFNNVTFTDDNHINKFKASGIIVEQ